jgi:hypothetical protein
MSGGGCRKGRLLAHRQQGELGVPYCFVFLSIAARGSGPYSVDAMMRKR